MNGPKYYISIYHRAGLICSNIWLRCDVNSYQTSTSKAINKRFILFLMPSTFICELFLDLNSQQTNTQSQKKKKKVLSMIKHTFTRLQKKEIQLRCWPKVWLSSALFCCPHIFYLFFYFVESKLMASAPAGVTDKGRQSILYWFNCNMSLFSEQNH